MTHPRYRNPAWLWARKHCLARDGHECQIRLPGCTQRATEACHIVRPEEGGALYDLTNLRAGCKHCNVSERNTQLAQRAKRKANNVQAW